MYVVDLTIPYDSSVGFMDHQASRKVTKYEVLRPLLIEKFQVDGVEILGWALRARGLITGSGGKVSEKVGRNG